MYRERKFNFVKLIIWFLGVCLLCQPLAAADDEEEAPRDLSGRWKVHLTNDLGWKSCTFDIEQDRGRLRGKLLIYGADETDLDGKFLGGNEIQLWATFKEGRTGATRSLEFKGVFEGEPGEEELKGTAYYFRKHYDWTAKRRKKKKKS